MRNSSTPTASVVMPCFNAAKFLIPALESILNQTAPDLEILAIDDGSTDATPDILREFSRDARVRVITLQHVGISAALNAGLEEARAELVVRMDSDDIAHPRRVEIQTGFMRENEHFVAVGASMRVIDPEGAVLRVATRPPWADMDRAFRTNPLFHPTVVMRRRQVLAIGGYRAEMQGAEDYDLWLRLVTAGQAISNVSDVLLDYRIHGNNASSKVFEQSAAHARALLEFRTLAAGLPLPAATPSKSSELLGAVAWGDFDCAVRMPVRADYLKRIAKYSSEGPELEHLGRVEREVWGASREEPTSSLLRPSYLLARRLVRAGRPIAGFRWLVRAFRWDPRQFLHLMLRDMRAFSRRS